MEKPKNWFWLLYVLYVFCMFCEGMLILRFVRKSLELILEVDKFFFFYLKDGHTCAQYLFLRSLT